MKKNNLGKKIRSMVMVPFALGAIGFGAQKADALMIDLNQSYAHSGGLLLNVTGESTFPIPAEFIGISNVSSEDYKGFMSSEGLYIQKGVNPKYVSGTHVFDNVAYLFGLVPILGNQSTTLELGADIDNILGSNNEALFSVIFNGSAYSGVDYQDVWVKKDPKGNYSLSLASTANPVPEPSSIFLLASGIGMAGVGGRMRSKKKILDTMNKKQ